MAKRNTRELILVTSLALFNELGEPNVTTNHIADEADISPGNLYYHFNSKDEIVLELYKRFLARIIPLLDIPDDRSLDAEDLWLLMHLAFEVKSEFRFIYRNLSDLTARIPDLERAMRGLLMREKTAISTLLRGLEQQGALAIDPQQRVLLLDNILLAATYWIPYADVFDRQSLEAGSAPVDSIARVLQMLIPYLREPERRQFTSLVNHYLTGR